MLRAPSVERRGVLTTMAAVTRADLSAAVCRKVGLARSECADLLDAVLDTVSDRLASGEAVKLRSFGSFTVHAKPERMGRNPKTGEAWPISARQVVVFRPSLSLKDRVDQGMRDETGRAE